MNLAKHPAILPALSTPRLELRPAHVDHAHAQAVAVGASLEELKPWLPWAAHAPTEADAAENLQEAVQAFEQGREMNWTVWLKDTEEFVGRVSIFALDWKALRGEVGYWLATTHYGQGLMREAVRAVISVARELGLKELEARCDTLNTRSMAVVQALGFQPKRILWKDMLAPNDPTTMRDTAVFVLEL